MKYLFKKVCQDALSNLPAWEINGIKNGLLADLGIKVYLLSDEEVESVFKEVFGE